MFSVTGTVAINSRRSSGSKRRPRELFFRVERVERRAFFFERRNENIAGLRGWGESKLGRSKRCGKLAPPRESGSARYFRCRDIRTCHVHSQPTAKCATRWKNKLQPRRGDLRQPRAQ